MAYAPKEVCSGPLEVKGPSGFLSSHIAEENGCGTLDNPWFVTVQPGQRIQFTLMDFDRSRQNKDINAGQVRAII